MIVPTWLVAHSTTKGEPVDAFEFAASDERGQTMAEYGVVLSLITIAIVGLLASLGTGIGHMIETVQGLL